MEIDVYGKEGYKKWISNLPLNEKAIEKNINGSRRFKECIKYFSGKVFLKKIGSMELFSKSRDLIMMKIVLLIMR